MDKNFEATENDPYLRKRKNPGNGEQQLYLKEVNFTCPLCGKDLRNRSQRKQNKLYEIAHIYPNSPTPEQRRVLADAPRLGENSESFENKIALCRDCHASQDYHTTLADYMKLYDKKKSCLENENLRNIVMDIPLHEAIAEVVKRIVVVREDELSLNYTPVELAKKFSAEETLLKMSIRAYATQYYPYIRDLFREKEGRDNFVMEAFCLMVKSKFLEMAAVTTDKRKIFDQMTQWFQNRALTDRRDACEALTAFFVQNCEVFYEITE